MPDPDSGKPARTYTSGRDNERWATPPAPPSAAPPPLVSPVETPTEQTVEMQKGQTRLWMAESPVEQSRPEKKNLETAGSVLCVAALIGGIVAGGAHQTNLLLLAAGVFGLGLIVFVIGRLSTGKKSP